MLTYLMILATLTEVDLDTFWPLTRMMRSPLRRPDCSALEAKNQKAYSTNEQKENYFLTKGYTFNLLQTSYDRLLLNFSTFCKSK